MGYYRRLHAMNRSFYCSLLFLLSATVFADDSPTLGVWYGSIGDYPIMLCMEKDKTAYYYEGQSSEIELTMKNSARWVESVKGVVTGHWKISEQPNSSRINGIWSNARGKGNKPFKLFYLDDVGSACSSSSYQQTLLIPGEPRLSLPLAQARPAVMANGDFAAVLTANGELWRWSKKQPQPKPELIGKDYVQVALDLSHALGIKNDGSLWDLQSGIGGPLGGETDVGARPFHMGDGFVSVAVYGEFGVGLRKDGTLWSWASPESDTEHNPLMKRPVKPTLRGKSFVSLSTGDGSFAAIKNDGTLWMWGSTHDGQSLVDNGGSWLSRLYRYAPPGRDEEGFMQVSVNGHTAAIKKDGSLWTWGSGKWGQLGNGMDEGDSSLPIKVGDGFSQVVTSSLNTAAIKADGTLWLWGANQLEWFGDCSTARIRNTPVQVGKDFVQVALGNEFLLALKQDGSVWTLGWPWEGDQLDVPRACRKPARVQFGDGVSGWDKPAKGAIKPKLSSPAMPANIISIAAGGSHSAMVKADGSLWAWGNNEYGQLADGTTQNHNRPKRIGDGFKRVTIDDHYTLALKNDGDLMRWGAIPTTYLRGDFSQSRDKALAPTRIFPETAVLLHSGYQTGRGLGLRADGTILDWGYYSETSKAPTVFGHAVREIGASAFGSYAIRNDGSLWELSQYPIDPPPKQVGNNFLNIVVGAGCAYGIKADGSLWAWGGNHMYQLGDGTQTGHADPVRIGEGFVQVAIGRLHGIALAADGSVWTWGDNEVGAIGDGTTLARAKPVKIGTGFTMVAAGDYHTVALKADGTVWAWGANEEGQIGDGTNIKRLTPTQIYPEPSTHNKGVPPSTSSATTGAKTTDRTVTAVRVGLYFSCASFSDGQFMCWGSNAKGQLGNDRRLDQNPTPIVVENKGGVAELFSASPMIDCQKQGKACDKIFSRYAFLRGASAIVDHFGFVCALKKGKIRCSGRNDGGSSRSVVDGIHDAVMFDHDGDHGCALLSDGRVKCWGDNSHGELGNGTVVTGYQYHFGPLATEVVSLDP